MRRNRIYQPILIVAFAGCLVTLFAAGSKARLPLLPLLHSYLVAGTPDSPDVQLKYPLKDREGDFISDKPDNPFYLKDPAAIEERVEYDPETGMYVLTEKVGGVNIKPPTYMTYEEFLKYTEQQERKKYWKERANAVLLIEDKNVIPPIQIKKQFFDRLFGGSKIEIRPQGNVEMTLGANVQRTANPNIPIRNRTTGGFDFDMNINMNVIGKIGDKLQMGIKYNTQSGFDFDNQIRLGYTGDEDDIIKVIEGGNVSLPLNTRLITGSQTLFGIKTQLQFGRLTWTSVVSQQKSKKESITIESGAQRQQFEIKADQYDENKHFFLSQYFRDMYDYALSGLPNIKSVVNITRLEVWVTNRTGSTQNVRDVVAFMDLGEANPYSPAIVSTANGDNRPRNEANNLYGKLISDPSYRYIDNVVATLIGPGFNLQQGQDFEKTYSRKLNENEYTFHRQLGYISLNTQLNPNEVLAVAFQYEYNGQVFQVGEFGNQVPPDSNTTSKALFLKMLKGSTIRPNLPIFDLMMKNIYSLGAYNLTSEDFRLDIYYNDPGGGLKRYLPKGCLQGEQLLRVMNLDNLNMNGDPQRDGLFDWIPGVTILTQNGRLIFPQKEPFGSNLRDAIVKCGTPADTLLFVYQQLYDSTKFWAQQFPEYNRYIIKGQYRGAGGREISLGAGNIPKGSVVVLAGGQKLTEGTHYTVDYNLGRITIIDGSILNSGQQIKVDFENNNLFATQLRSLYGTRLDYRVNRNLNIGGTVITMGERPFTPKVNIGEDPIRNTIMGLDVRHETNAPWLTKALDRIPFYSTKEMSTINSYAEVAHLRPGHARAIRSEDREGQVYIDDFEGTSNGYVLANPPNAWKLGSAPRGATNAAGKVMFPEADRVNDSTYGYNRAKISWYRIDNLFFNPAVAPDVVKNNPANYQNHYARLVPMQEVFPNRPIQTLDQNLYTFDVSFFPRERGPYNYEYSSQPTPGVSAGVDADGYLKQPKTRWGAIMRSIDNNDLEATNVEFIEFWLLDPFLYNTTSSGGKLYFHLGSISEDILRDSRMSYENGITTQPGAMDSTSWGYVPKLPPLVDGFDNNPDLRPVQDVGLDCMNDEQERTRKAAFLQNIQWMNPLAVLKLSQDPSSDNYRFFNDDYYNNTGNILTRYKDFCGLEGNSPAQINASQTTAQTNLPEKEDLNKDNSLNENEEYFQYEVDLRPGMDVGNHPYIVSKIQGTGKDHNGVENRWLQFRIPIRQYSARIGNIPDFKSIQFIRMLLTGWEDSVTLRFGSLELVRNQWRTYTLDLNDPCESISTENDPPFLNVASVGIEENSAKKPVNYVLPPNIQRELLLGQQTNQFVQQNEQALSVRVCNLKDCQTRAVFKNTTLDLRRYKRLRMNVHASRFDGELPVKDNEVIAFVRLGTDFKDNYYQYEIPLKITPDGKYDNNSKEDRSIVWPDANFVDIAINELVDLKLKRNAADYPRTVPYYATDSKGRNISIVGNPDIGAIRTIMLGIKNPSRFDPNNPLKDADDGLPKCIEVWFNEMRATGFDEFGGTAAVGSLNIKLADLGNINLSGGMHTRGFGQVEQRIDQRFKDNLYQYDFSTTIELGKFLPQQVGLRMPFYGAYAQSFSTPEFDPYQFDIPTRTMLRTLRSEYGGDSVRNYLAQVQTINTRRGFNFTNVRIVPQTKSKKPHIYDPGNFAFTYAYNEILFTDPFIEKNSRKNWLGIINWSFAPQTKSITPFKKIIKSKSRWLDLIRDFNFTPIPATLSVNSEWNREFNEIKLRELGEVDFDIPSTYFKNFRWIRSYNFKMNPFQSLSIDFTANNQSRIDEPDGPLDTKPKRQEVWNNAQQGGRNNAYTQTLAVNYNIPINKIPIFDFITANAGFNTNYSWTALPWQRDSATNRWVQNSLGNIITNGQNDRVKLDFNFRKLYDKVPFLKTYNAPNPQAGNKKENDKKREAVKKAREKIADEITKLKEKRIKIKEDLAKAKQKIKEDSPTIKKQRDDIAKALADLDKNATQIAEKKGELRKAKGKKEKEPVRNAINTLLTQRKKLKENLRDARRGTEISRLEKELKANKKSIRQKKKDYAAKQPPPNPFISIPVRPLLSLKRVTVEYKENKSTTLPGFVGYSQILGNQITGNKFTFDPAIRQAPGFDFSFGWQPGDRFWRGVDAITRDAWLDKFAARGWMSNDTLINQKFTQNRSQRLDITATLEPWSDFKIDLTLFRDYTENHAQFFKKVWDTVANDYVFRHLNPMDMGSYSISYLPVRTMFYKIDTQGNSQIYKSFEAYRPIISKRLGGGTYVNPTEGTPNPNYAYGYGPKSQDVLIPAFMAAYTKADPNKINLNPFKAIPLPNWRISYNGFTKFSWMQKHFTNFTITHGYNSTLTINSFQTNLDFTNSVNNFGTNRTDTLSGNYFPLFNMPSIVINEQLSPLLGIDMVMKNNVTAKVDYKMSRTLTMNFADFQMIEMKSMQFTIGAGYKIKGLKLPFKLPKSGKYIKLDNDLNFRFDFSYRDNITVNHRIDELPQITQGARTITIQPSIDYIISKRMNIRLFFDQTRTVPKISTGFPTTNTRGGITLRFSLAE
ncbi:MAG: cell surface protein SprA [Chitinophagales bacterium]|nr:cell surface protein SprA [Chitinophagales bacterium]MDW8419471.1 cell surface protein SprA [Chitinophagales bacterium]